jgi:hypothetical protein
MIEVMERVPEWCGLIVAEQGPRGGIRFQVARNPAINPEVNPVMMAHLLWSNEAVKLLIRAGYMPKDLRRPRKQLYEMLCEAITLQELTTEIRIFMMQRQEWRDRLIHA